MLSFFGIVLLLLAGTVTRGYALAKLWLWFIEPTFNAPHISIPVALGISVIVGMLTHEGAPKDESLSERDRLIQGCGAAILAPLFSLGIGWILLQFR